MAEKQKNFRTNLSPEDAQTRVVQGVMSWKMGKAFGVKPAGQNLFEATRAGKQTGSTVSYTIHSQGGSTEVAVRVATVSVALKNPMTGVFKSVEKSLREGDPGTIAT